MREVTVHLAESAREECIPEKPVVRSRSSRTEVRGKFLFAGPEKFYVRGVTYGTFRTDGSGDEQYRRDLVERDFQAIAANGLNAIRTYTVPPLWFLNLADEHGLKVMIGLPWEQHINFLDDKRRCLAIEETVRA